MTKHVTLNGEYTFPVKKVAAEVFVAWCDQPGWPRRCFLGTGPQCLWWLVMTNTVSTRRGLIYLGG